MKCPRCTHEHKRSLGMNCGGCGYNFVFDPKHSWGISDEWFTGLLNRASANDTRYFTLRSLRAQFVTDYRTKMTKSSGCLFAFITVPTIVVIAGIWTLASGLGFWLVLLPVLVAFFLFRERKSQVERRPSVEEFGQWIADWERRQGQLPKLLKEPSLEQGPDSPAESDVYNYGVQMVMIVDDDLMVDFLVKNGWAQEKGILVVSQNQYPSHVYELAVKFLRGRKDLPVRLFHSAEVETMRATLLSRGFPIDGHPVVDIGLDLRQMRRQKWLKRQYPKAEPSEITPDCFPPGMILQLLGASVGTGVAVEVLLGRAASHSSGSSSLELDTDFG